MAGAERMSTWAQGLEACPQGQCQAHALWHSIAGEERYAHVTLPDACVDGLQSAVHRGGLLVTLWSYQVVTNVPSGVVCGDAEEMLLWSDFTWHLGRGLQICWLADVIRLLAVKIFGGWCMDCDTLWIVVKENAKVP